ncbi:MAG: hypothetical protein QM811_14480 [Pirellulales bacterium]
MNSDRVEKSGSTYKGLPEDDFLTANDVWFMPVVQKTGPDGSLYVLDWYDRYHCYQDANRDPAGIDRGLGRLYRIRYGDTPRAKPFDLSKESDAELIERLKSPNVFYRDLAQRILTERANPRSTVALEALVFDEQAPRKSRLHALYVLVGSNLLTKSSAARLLDHKDPTFVAWGVRGRPERADRLDDVAESHGLGQIEESGSPAAGRDRRTQNLDHGCRASVAECSGRKRD